MKGKGRERGEWGIEEDVRDQRQGKVEGPKAMRAKWNGEGGMGGRGGAEGYSRGGGREAVATPRPNIISHH